MNNLLVNGVFVQLGDKYLDNNMRVGEEVEYDGERLVGCEYKKFKVVTDEGNSTIWSVIFIVEEDTITMVLTDIFCDDALEVVMIDVEDEMNS